MTRSAFVVLVLAAVLTACSAGAASDATPPPAETPTASPSPTPSVEPTPSPSPSVDPSPTPEAEETPSPVTGDIPADTVVETIVEGLTVRRDAGTSGERIGFLPLGTMAFVLAGPQEVDGTPWYRISGMGVPYASGCITVPAHAPLECPAFQGWVAGANEAGDPWIAPADHEPCPEADLRTMSEMGFTWRLVCWADEPITFEAWWPEIPDDAGLGGRCDAIDQPGGFLYCQNINYNGLSASPQEGFVTRLALSIDPASGLEMPERGQWIRVTGGFDHPAAQACADLPEPEWEDAYGAVFACRREFVPTSIEALGS